MAAFLFWNLNKKPLAAVVASLARQHSVDLIFLAECTVPPVDLLAALNSDTVEYRYHYSPNTRVMLYSRFPSSAVQNLRDTGGISIKRLHPPLGPDILVAAVHLSSKLHLSDDDQSDLCKRLADYIRKAEGDVGHRRTLAVGDFNMDPFQRGVAGSEGLHAVMDRSVASKSSRVVSGEERPFLYNPIWPFIGAPSGGTLGTYYYSSARPLCYYWHTFDQVLLRPDLLPLFRDSTLRVITEVAGKPLLRSGVPDTKFHSDHLPIFFSLDLEQG